jgi:hypothetical protein
MHDCLRVHEITELICQDLLGLGLDGGGANETFAHSPGFTPWQAPPPGSKDLAAVARTCMTLNGPALDCLWRFAKLGSLRCLPSDLWAIHETPLEYSVVS